MVDLTEVLKQLGTTNRFVGGGGLNGLIAPQALPDAGPVPLPSMPNQTPSVPTDVHGLPALPPLKSEPQLTAGYLPTWPEAAYAGVRNLAPQTVDAATALGSGAANVAMQGGIAPAIVNRYARTGTWRDAIAKAADDYSGVVQSIVNEPSRLAGAYLSGQTELKKQIANNPLGTLMDATMFLTPENAAARAAVLAEHSTGPLTEALRNRMVKPPAVQGMLDPEIARVVQEQQGAQSIFNPEGASMNLELQNPRQFDPLREPPAENTIGRIQQAQDLADRQAGTVGMPSVGTFDPLREPPPADTVQGILAQQDLIGGTDMPSRAGIDEPRRFSPLVEPVAPDTIGRVQQAQDRMQKFVGVSEPLSLGNASFDPLAEPAARDTMGRVMQAQDRMAVERGTQKSFAGDANNRAWFDPLQEPPPADTLQRVLAKQDKLGGSQARSMEEWQLGRPGEPNKRQLEEHAGRMQTLRGTPTEPTTTGEMSNPTLRNRIKQLQVRRAYATNKADREYYDRRIGEMQDAQRTPEATETGGGGMAWFRRTQNPSDTAIPFRAERMTDMDPREVGISGPGKTPGTFRLTQDQGKHWTWRREDTPETPGSRTISDLAGRSAVGHAGHWTGSNLGGGDRIWRWNQDTFNSPIGTTTAEHNDAMAAALAQGSKLPGVRWHDQPPPAHRIVGSAEGLASQQRFDNMLARARVWGQVGGIPNKMDNLVDQAVNDRMARWNDTPPPPEPAPPSLGLLDPRFHPRPDFKLQPPVARAEFKQPTNPGILGTNPFDPAAARYKAPQDVATPAVPEPSGQKTLPMFGLHPDLDFYTPAGRDLFRTEAAKAPWDTFKARKLTGLESGVNDSYERYFENDKEHPYFTKTRTKHGNIALEAAALHAGDSLGVNVLPVVQYSDDSIVTPWVKGKTIGNSNRGELKNVIQNMNPKERDKQIFYEFLIADTDKHDWNYFVDKKNNKIVGIDYGKALNGDSHTFLQRNSYVAAVRDALPRGTEISRDAMREMVANEKAATQHFIDAGASKRALDGLKQRFQLLKEFSQLNRPLSLDDLDTLPHGGR